MASRRRARRDTPDGRVSAEGFYETYHGHQREHLEAAHSALRAAGKRIIWLAGDSSLDNKYWLLPSSRIRGPSSGVPAVNGYEHILSPPRSVPDVAHHVNAYCAQHSLPYAALNAAVEESSVGQRDGGATLLPQDDFLRDHLQAEDIIVVSVGGNDVALHPTVMTILSMACMIFCCPRPCIRAACALGLGHFTRMYTRDGARYLAGLTSKCTPAAVLMCSIYFPDMAPTPSWAGRLLGLLGYDSNPGKLQDVIRAIYTGGICRVTVPGVRILPVPLFEALDGSDSEHYVARVEPSASGGERMAGFIMRLAVDAGVLVAASGSTPLPAASEASAAAVEDVVSEERAPLSTATTFAMSHRDAAAEAAYAVAAAEAHGDDDDD